ncbi:hypothetical protein [Streptomyces abyssomicinicus]|uniref:hypothetical protein n=1 Tax=Streptomyces abyssomicinicus TaxID=574929 RepID=UPI00124FB762|nr:hypothetical protein [Streptomyces abyssomicinicus]
MTGTARTAERARPGRGALRTLGAAAAGVAALLALQTTPAGAAEVTMAEPYTGMDTCPVGSALLTQADNRQVGCVHTTIGSGSFSIGDYTVPVGSPMEIDFGFRWSAAGPRADTGTSRPNIYDTAPATDGLLEAPVTEAPLPGLSNFWPGVTSADVKVEPAGDIKNFTPLAAGSQYPIFELPIKLKIEHPLLGPKCYVGTNSNPIVLQAIAPNRPQLSQVLDPNGHPTVTLRMLDGQLTDSDFAIPGASRCGLLALGESNWIVNSLFDLPSASGNSISFDDVDVAISIDSSLQSLTAALNDARG